ncbi:MAG: YegS/Rv2252/BmrU family lipid kinase [Vicingus serpentipes]|nr:YegS/Rv2252/BmrU family lipid kinase [Vicingus serpentipes]
MNNKKEILFIINPVSGTGKQKVVEDLITKHLDKTIFNTTIQYTQQAKHAIEIGEQAAGKFDIVVAVGGDGTVNEVAKGLINTNTSLAIIATGSGNGLARHLQIPMNPKDAILRINQLNYKKIDTIKINEYHFLGTAGTGFDAHIGWRFAEATKRGFWTYLKITVKEYFNYQEENYTINVDGKEIKTKALLITFANSNQYGNNVYVSPNSIIDDGFLQIIILKRFPLIYAFEFAYRIFSKKLSNFKFVTELKGKRVTIISPKNELHIDGEPFKMEKNIHLEVVPKSLNILT